jgi:hypothetical protein
MLWFMTDTGGLMIQYPESSNIPGAHWRVFESSRRFRASRFKELGASDITAHNDLSRLYQKSAIEGANQGIACNFCL